MTASKSSNLSRFESFVCTVIGSFIGAAMFACALVWLLGESWTEALSIAWFGIVANVVFHDWQYRRNKR